MILPLPRDPRVPRLPRLCFSGGPCSGKSSASAILRQRLPELGVTPLFVPEVATAIFSSGLNVLDVLADPDRWYGFQHAMVQAQIAQEDAWERFAATMPGERKVLICDRGVMDGMAYIDPAAFESILEDLGLDVTTARDLRYDAVFHLVTAARGAEAYYNLDNAARTEDLATARLRDEATLKAWTGHRALRVLANTEIVGGVTRAISFADKMERLLQETCRVLGLPAPSRVEKKLLVRVPDATPAALGGHGVVSEIAQTYLQAGEDGAVERRVRATRPRGAAGGRALYVYTEKRRTTPGQPITTERVLSAREYHALRADRDLACAEVRKERTAFVYADRPMRLDRLVAPVACALLEVDVPTPDTAVALPPGIEVLADVTDDPAYTNHALARTTPPAA